MHGRQGEAAAAGRPPTIVARDLTKRYADVVALDGLEIEVPAGASLGLLGPEGAGKSTFIRLAAGLARPSGGTLQVDGRPAASAPIGLRRRMGVLQQEPRYYGWMTGREVVAFAADLAGVARRTLADRVTEMLEVVGLAAAADRRVAEYSPAQRQALAIGQALVGRPSLLLLDEPVASLDPWSRGVLIRRIAELRGEATLIVASNVRGDLEPLADRLVRLEAGRVMPG
jgi:ABC-2 type transport system ATP-binding protein